MCIYEGYNCIYLQDRKFLGLKLSLGGLYTDANNNADADNDNTTQQTEHDCIGSLPNEPKLCNID